jgi:fatty acid desaturase
VELKPASYYVKELRKTLPDAVFEPATSRVLWLPVHAAIIGSLAWSMATGRLPWLLWPVASIIIGGCLAGLVFLGHETLHGGVVRGKTTIRVIGWTCFLPFMLSPQLWVAWHNRVHHNHCAKAGVDPDMYPTLEEYETQPAARIMADHFGLGRSRILSLLSLFFGFTGQSQQMLWTARRRGMLGEKLFRRALVESALGAAFWVAVALLVGFVPFLFVYALPLVVVNTIVMMFIMSNHNLSPLTDVNDPLVNSLSVTMPRWLEFLTLDFGFHAEHHTLPQLSQRHGRILREALITQFPGRYQTMPLAKALVQIYHSARVYKDDVTLIDPPSGRTWPTLVPDDALES